jgi:single-strand DNA-binding protein
MSNGLNRVTLFGNLGADPELRKLHDGQSLLKLRLATNYSVMTREGVREDRVEWHRVNVWGARGEGLSRVLHKGSFLLVEGQLRTNSYEKDGEKRYSTEVHAFNVILGGRCGPDGHRELPEMAENDDVREPAEIIEARRDGRDMDEPGELVAFEPTKPGPKPGPQDGGAHEPPPPPPPPPRRKSRAPQTPTAAMAAA